MNKVNNSTEPTLKDINPDLTYKGYLWMSDSDIPTLLNREKLRSKILITSNSGKKTGNQVTFDEMKDTSNPFIIEGQLYSENANLSFSIKFVDGKHIVAMYNLNEIPKTWVFNETDDLKKFAVNRMKGVSKLKFRQYWKPEPDKLCEGMEVLVPAGYVFLGFENELKVKEEKS